MISLRFFIRSFALCLGGASAVLGWSGPARADFGCPEEIAFANETAIERLVDRFGEAQARHQERCMVALIPMITRSMIELLDGTESSFSRYRQAMVYLGKTDKLNAEARAVLEDHLTNVFLDYNYLEFYHQHFAETNRQVTQGSTLILGAATVAALVFTRRWLQAAASEPGLQSIELHVKSLQSSGQRQLKLMVLKGSQVLTALQPVNPRVIASSYAAVKSAKGKRRQKARIVDDMLRSPIILSGSKRMHGYFANYSYGRELSVEIGKVLTAFTGGVWVGYKATEFSGALTEQMFGFKEADYFARWGKAILPKPYVPAAQAPRVLQSLLYAKNFVQSIPSRVVSAFTVVGFAASTATTLMLMRTLEVAVQAYNRSEFESGIRDLKAAIEEAVGKGDDYAVYLLSHELASRLRTLEAMMTPDLYRNRADAERDYLTASVTGPVCAYLKGDLTAMDGAADRGRVTLIQKIQAGSIFAHATLEDVSVHYRDGLKFLSGMNKPYLSDIQARLQRSYDSAILRIDSDYQIGQILESGSQLRDEFTAVHDPADAQNLRRALACPGA